jgi:hypothetical protein
MNMAKEPLYRKQNKLARGLRHSDVGGSFRHERNSKAMSRFDGSRLSMGRTKAGYDYTPLFKFLLSRVGRRWDEVFSEAVSRLDRQEPIFWIVDLQFEKGRQAVVRVGENAYYSVLTVVEGVLVVADPSASCPTKSCACCTHTINGKVF